VRRQRLRGNLEQHGWDGDWYRRAYFDDGTPLGSAGQPECRIDSIAQSWSVLSGAGEPARTHQAMDSLDARLVRRDAGLIQLLDPPFDQSTLDPGYIKGYVPGVRENGGQYTHAAIWAAMAFAQLGDRTRAWELFDIINPINHARTPADVATYKVEPYVIAADVYAVSPHVGRGGWTWYTGSAGWMYRLIVESLLGLRLEGETLHIEPCLPADWDGFKLSYRYRETRYQIVGHSRVSRGGRTTAEPGWHRASRLGDPLDRRPSGTRGRIAAHSRQPQVAMRKRCIASMPRLACWLNHRPSAARRGSASASKPAMTSNSSSSMPLWRRR
jgi:cyclic beta-1,2-glucan synthetase